ncbi:MAG: IS21 family transposase [Lysobacteraceae bacterium]|nr:MAG: IS21 family transposase [Xanthomonadaceae bacterium]
MVMLAKIRRMHFRDGMSVREVAKRTGLSRNTVRRWLRQGTVEPKYPARTRPLKLDPFRDQLEAWLRTDSHRPKRDRRTAKVLFQQLQAAGFTGGYGRVAEFVQRWRLAGGGVAKPAFVPLSFPPGEAFQFDWSCEYAVIAGKRCRLEVAHVKLASSRAFWLVAYPAQSHEMLFDAHTRAFAAFGGVPRRGIYDNMKTAVDQIDRQGGRKINRRFQALHSHYLFEPEFCNRAAGWEKGVVEKNVQDRRRRIWIEVNAQSWDSFDALNAWLAQACPEAWTTLAHPESSTRTVAQALAEEHPHLMPMPAAFDGYVELSARVSSTALVSLQRNRYSVPCPHAHALASLRVYPFEVVIVIDQREVARHRRSFDRERVCYDWRHYIDLIQRKPGALRDGAPFQHMPPPLRDLQRHLLRQPKGDRAMAQVLAAVPTHGLEAVLVAVELVLASGLIGSEHVLNVLARLEHPATTVSPVATVLPVAPRPDVQRYDRLRGVPDVA